MRSWKSSFLIMGSSWLLAVTGVVNNNKFISSCAILVLVWGVQLLLLCQNLIGNVTDHLSAMQCWYVSEVLQLWSGIITNFKYCSGRQSPAVRKWQQQLYCSTSHPQHQPSTASAACHPGTNRKSDQWHRNNSGTQTTTSSHSHQLLSHLWHAHHSERK